MPQTLSRNETTSMRGVAIMFIVLHNLLHWILPTKENEFSFSKDYSNLFFERIADLHPHSLGDVFSFLGWYGVVVFLFLSGYGLVKKYGIYPPLATKQFILQHFKSVFFLMFLPYVPFALLSIYHMDFKHVLLQASLLINVVDPNGINPGVYWFFGLIMQFYVLFALLRTLKSTKSFWVLLALLNIISLVWLFLLQGNALQLNWVRHNCIGWLLPFSMGIWFAYSVKWKYLFDAHWKNFLWLIVGGILVALSNLNYYVWIFSSVMAIFAAIGLVKLVSSIEVLEKVCIWIGGLSAFIFAVHPVVRFLCQKLCFSEMLRLPYLLGYVLVTVWFAVIYKCVHKRLISRWL